MLVLNAYYSPGGRFKYHNHLDNCVESCIFCLFRFKYQKIGGACGCGVDLSDDSGTISVWSATFAY